MNCAKRQQHVLPDDSLKCYGALADRPNFDSRPIMRAQGLLLPRQYAVVEQIGRHQRVLAIAKFGEGELGVGVEKRLLINAAHALDGAGVVGVLHAEIAGMEGLDFALGFSLPTA